MEIILRQAVENLGKPGDVVTVKNGYARNFLLPRGFAYEATPGNLKRISQERGRLEAAENERVQSATELAKRLEEVQLTFSARVGEEGKLFGSVTSADIAGQLAEKGYTIDRRKIALDDPLRSLGEFHVPIKLHREVTSHVKVTVKSEPTDETETAA
jgi:large subunit ribosomal protein L9